MKRISLVLIILLAGCAGSPHSARKPASMAAPIVDSAKANNLVLTLSADAGFAAKLQPEPGLQTVCMGCTGGSVCLNTSKKAVSGQIFDFKGKYYIDSAKDLKHYSDSCIALAYTRWSAERDACTRRVQALETCAGFHGAIGNRCSELQPKPRTQDELRDFLISIRTGVGPECAYGAYCATDGRKTVLLMVTDEESVFRSLTYTRLGDPSALGDATMGDLNRCLQENHVQGAFEYPDAVIVPATFEAPKSEPAVREDI